MKNAIFLSLLFIAYHSSAQIICPDDLTINCDQDYTDVELTGAPSLPGELDFYSASYLPQLNACGIGNVTATFTREDSIICTQTITIENPFPAFDPSTIVIPSDTTVTDCGLLFFEGPNWAGGPCDFIGYTEDIDTFESNIIGEFIIEKTFTVIDWCLYDETNGAQGLYFGNQIITVLDEVAPTPFCISIVSLNAEDMPETINARSFNIGTFDECTPKEKLRFTFSDVTPELDPTFDVNSRTSSKIITDDDLSNGLLFIDVYHWDLAGNADFCSVAISLLTSTSDLNQNEITLSHNHPNPFNGTTTINFELKKSADLTISVYDITGKEHLSISEYYAAGSYNKSLDLSKAPSGTLLYRVTANSSTVSGKMTKM